MRTVKKPEVRKREILAGALEVFLRNGYEGTTIADIAKELSISQGLCYRYFTSKEAVYDAVIDTYSALIVEENLRIRPRNQSIRQWLDSIPHMLDNMEKAERENPQLYALLHNPQNEKMHMELCMKVGRLLLPVVTEVLEQANGLGEIRLTDCRKTAVFGIYGEIGLMTTGEIRDSAAIQQHWKMLLGLT